jgi:hypothetical protein
VYCVTKNLGKVCHISKNQIVCLVCVPFLKLKLEGLATTKFEMHHPYHQYHHIYHISAASILLISTYPIETRDDQIINSCSTSDSIDDNKSDVARCCYIYHLSIYIGIICSILQLVYHQFHFLVMHVSIMLLLLEHN